jgi:hypothetical protein
MNTNTFDIPVYVVVEQITVLFSFKVLAVFSRKEDATLYKNKYNNTDTVISIYKSVLNPNTTELNTFVDGKYKYKW